VGHDLVCVPHLRSVAVSRDVMLAWCSAVSERSVLPGADQCFLSRPVGTTFAARQIGSTVDINVDLGVSQVIPLTVPAD